MSKGSIILIAVLYAAPIVFYFLAKKAQKPGEKFAWGGVRIVALVLWLLATGILLWNKGVIA